MTDDPFEEFGKVMSATPAEVKETIERVAAFPSVFGAPYGPVESDESWEASEALLGKLPPGETAVMSKDQWFVTYIGDTSIEMFVPTPDEKEDAQTLLLEIDTILDKIVEQQEGLEVGWVALGARVHAVREKKCWIDYGYENFPAFIDYVATRAKRKRSYIYQCKAIAETLLPQLSAETLNTIGITRATELKKLAAKNIPISDDLVERAKTSKTDELKAEVETLINPASSEEKGTWFDFGGFYLTEEEKILFEESYKLATQGDVIPANAPDHVKRKIAVVRWCAEFYGTYRGSNG